MIQKLNQNFKYKARIHPESLSKLKRVHICIRIRTIYRS